MNYIKKLEAENAELRAREEAARAELAAFRAFLHSDKFTGVESDGGRKDWISTGDVLTKLGEVRDALNGTA